MIVAKSWTAVPSHPGIVSTTNLLDAIFSVARPLPPVGNTAGSNSYITHEVNLDGLGFVARRKTSIVHDSAQQTRTQTKPQSVHNNFMPPPGYVYIASEYRLVIKGLRLPRRAQCRHELGATATISTRDIWWHLIQDRRAHHSKDAY
jgi:hypothetical protein